MLLLKSVINRRDSTSRQELLRKAIGRVKTHTRKTASGKTVRVREHGSGKNKREQTIGDIYSSLKKDHGWKPLAGGMEKTFSGVAPAGDMRPDGSRLIRLDMKGGMIVATMGDEIVAHVLGWEFTDTGKAVKNVISTVNGVVEKMRSEQKK